MKKYRCLKIYCADSNGTTRCVSFNDYDCYNILGFPLDILFGNPDFIKTAVEEFKCVYHPQKVMFVRFEYDFHIDNGVVTKEINANELLKGGAEK